MKHLAPNYLFPLATTRTLQWTKQVVKGESTAKKPIKIRPINAVKKAIIKDVIKNKTIPLKHSKIVKTRDNLNPLLRAHLPEDPMRTADPRPANAMHVSPVDKNNYTGYSAIQK